jgi:dCTP diphosphatase
LPINQHDSISSPLDIWTSVHSLSLAIRQFAIERDWGQYHTPRNLALALMGEVGELAEIWQFAGDTVQVVTRKTLESVGQELADVAIYTMRLADVTGCNLERPTD